MFYSQSRNRHKHWYHMLSVGHKKLWALAIVCAFLLIALVTILIVYSIRAAGYDMRLIGGGLPSSTLYDTQHRVIAPLAEQNKAPVQWDELPERLVQAFLAREDAHFFDHNGVVYSALARSALRNILSLRYKQGASTITMQLTRHVFELQGKTLDRKLLEIVLAQRVENNYDKRTILCQYLSRIYFGQNCYGIREAARFYFGKSVRDLNLAESALLAGIVRAPSLYNPVRSMENARTVRRETLQRMLELGMITPDEYDSAEVSPITLQDRSSARSEKKQASYPAMWANLELDSLPDIQQERGLGLSVVSHLLTDLQSYLDRAVQEALAAVESPLYLPESWKSAENGASPLLNEAQQRQFATAKRPAWLTNDTAPPAPGQGKLQCCVLVVDARSSHRGNILAVTAGRDAEDGENHWLQHIRPGRAAAPFIFCCACLPGGNSHHIVANSAKTTGSRLGYGVVRTFFDTLALETTLPERDDENSLYEGIFPMRKIDLARLLFDLQNMGRGYKLSLISSIWSQGQRLLYTNENEQAPEYIRRESAVAVSHLPPFQYREGMPTVLHEELPENDGIWTMVFNERGVAVFVWMGIESPQSIAVPLDMRRIMSQAALALGKDVHTQARRILRAAAHAATTP